MDHSRDMRTLTFAVVFLVVLGLGRTALAGPPSLESFAGVVGGEPTNSALIPGPCSTYGGAPALTFFLGGGGLSVPSGGIATCGYSGDLTDVTGTVGPLPAMQSLGLVSLGNPGAYSGGAQASADYGTLRALAQGTVTGPAGDPLALANSAAAAFFDDTLNLSSPLVTPLSPAFVRYVFHFSGSATTPKPLLPFEPGTASAELSIQHNGGSPFPLVRVSSTRGSTGFIITRDGNTAGFVPGLGSIAGAGTFTSAITGAFGVVFDLPIIAGQPFELRAGLQAYVGGDGVSSFLTTAQLVDVLLFDANHNPVTTFTLTSASGTSYRDCGFGISPSSRAFGAAGGGDSVSVTAAGGCAWSAVSNDTFITVTSGASASGNGTVGYTVDANVGPARGGTVTIAGQTFTVTQDSGCAYSIAPTSAHAGAAGGTGSVTVTTAAGCVWTADSNDVFLHVTSGDTGSGPGTVGYSVDTNSNAGRSGTLTIAGLTFTVTQDGAVASNTPTGLDVHVPLLGGGITVAFADVLQPGVTTALPQAPCQPGDLCRSFTRYRVLGGLAFDVSTSATTSGPITLTFDLTKIPPSPITPPDPITPPNPIIPPNPVIPPDPITPPSPITPPNPVTPQFFATLRVLHGENGVLVDRTVLAPTAPCRPNDSAQTICASVTSLSPFALVQLAPYDVLGTALVDLLAVRQGTTDRKKGRELDAALDALTQALDPALWVDTFHLRGHDGDDVFDDTRRAVGKLTSWLADHDVQRVVDEILGADRELARVAVAEAVAAGGRPRKLADAQQDLLEGDAQVARTAYTGGIKIYRDAWQDAAESLRR